MKIGLNATCLNDRASGAKQRFVGINTALFDLLPSHEFIVYEPADCQIRAWFENFANVRFIRTPLLSTSRLQKFARGLLYWRTSLNGERFDIFEGFHLPSVKAPTGRTLLTIHDIRFMRDGGLSRAVYERILEQSLRAADPVITVSEAMRQEILSLFPDLAISVIHNGIDVAQFENIDAQELVATERDLRLPAEFMLTVGHLERRKNHLRLLSALAYLHARGRAIHLVIVGNDSGEFSRVTACLHKFNLQRYVTILNGLGDRQVRCLYKLCNLFVFPSLYEGFGIPILEAMASDRPMVLSDIPVFREITENQGVYFCPSDPESIAESIDTTLSSSAKQQGLVAYGRRRVQDFAFGLIAQRLARLYHELH